MWDMNKNMVKMARIFFHAISLLSMIDSSTAFLTIGWIDTVNNNYASALCEPDKEISITTPLDYFKLFSSEESRIEITSPCYCQLYIPTNKSAKYMHPELTLSTYVNRFQTLLVLTGNDEWGFTDSNGFFDFDVSEGDNATLILPYQEKSFALNSTIYMSINDNVTLFMRCRTEPYPPIIMHPPVVTEISSESYPTTNTTVINQAAVVTWYKNTRLLVITLVIIGCLLVFGLCLCCLVIRRRRKGKELGCDVDDKDWRLPTVVNVEGVGTSNVRESPVVDTFTDVETFIDEEQNATPSTSVDIPQTDTTTLDKQSSHGSLTPNGKNNKDNTDCDIITGDQVVENKFPLVLPLTNPPDVLKRGIYDNIDKLKQESSTVPNDGYVQAMEGSSTDMPENKTDISDSYKGIDEIPEYAEIEEMQLLLKKHKANKTGTGTSNTTTTSDISAVGPNQTPKSKKWRFGLRKNNKDKDQKKSVPTDKIRDKNGTIKLTDLDFSQLKEAIDNMDPGEVSSNMKKVSSTPTVGRKLPDPPEPIYTNEPLPRSAAKTLDKTTSKESEPLVKTSTFTKEDRKSKYDTPKPADVKFALDTKKDPSHSNDNTRPTGLNVGLASTSKEPESPRGQWGSPVNVFSQNDEPSSPRSKWGTPVSVLYAQPEKPSRLPRPTSPGPSDNVSSRGPISSKSAMTSPTTKSPISSYHVPKSTSAFRSPSIQNAFSKFETPSANKNNAPIREPGQSYRPTVMSSRNSALLSSQPLNKANVPHYSSITATPARTPSFRTSSSLGTNVLANGRSDPKPTAFMRKY